LETLWGPDCYFDLETAEAALRPDGSFHIVSMQSVTKFDFFPVGGDAFGTSQLARRRMAKVDFFVRCRGAGDERGGYCVGEIALV
jgi:hypothetical protein